MNYIYGYLEPYHTDKIGVENLFMSNNFEDVIKFMKEEIDHPSHKSSFVPFMPHNFLGTRGEFLRNAFGKIIPEIKDIHSDFYKDPDNYGLYKGKILTCNISININNNGNNIEKLRPCIYLNNKIYYLTGFPPYMRPEV